MDNKFDSIDNLESSIRKTSVIHERINLVSTHMYKQYLEYEQSVMNTKDIFLKIIDNTHETIEYLKQSFSARGIAAKNIFYEIDHSRSTLVLTILWHTISLILKASDTPQALNREGQPPVFSGRIMAISGNYSGLLRQNLENDMQALLEREIASLYIPSEKDTPAIIKIKHLGNREFYLNQIDSPKEFLLKVIETVCGGGIYHEESVKKGF